MKEPRVGRQRRYGGELVDAFVTGARLGCVLGLVDGFVRNFRQYMYCCGCLVLLALVFILVVILWLYSVGGWNLLLFLALCIALVVMLLRRRNR